MDKLDRLKDRRRLLTKEHSLSDLAEIFLVKIRNPMKKLVYTTGNKWRTTEEMLFVYVR